MKPINLKIKGLNSFVEEQEIDFERLTEAGFFGILDKQEAVSQPHLLPLLIKQTITVMLISSPWKTLSNIYILTECQWLTKEKLG